MGNGGERIEYALTELPADIQAAVVAKTDTPPPELLPALAPRAALTIVDRVIDIPTLSAVALGGAAAPAEGDRGAMVTQGNGAALPSFDPTTAAVPSFVSASSSPLPAWSPETAVSERDLADPRIRKILAVLREAEDIPRTWSRGRRAWIEAVAFRHGIRWQTVYSWMKKYDTRGIAGLRHSKATRNQPRAWDPDAVEWWISACARREHRHMDRKDIYEHLVIEADRRGWQIGGYASANWWFKKRWNPLLAAMQRGGLRALDNLLPPITRNYSDLDPFEILVGDQHRFDFWVVDDDTGEVFRPEGYLWQDLRTRVIYGAAIDRRYDAWLIGLALRIGIGCFGAFGSIYTDNGAPECSRYLTGILANLRSLGMAWERTDDLVADLVDVDPEDIDPHVPGTHRKAIVKNAKAKMIEGSFHTIERIMASHLGLPGGVKRLADDIHWQDIDHTEALALAKAGRLLTMREFTAALYGACDYYNRKRHHRGVHREWRLPLPTPAETTPMDRLLACCAAGWQPRWISAAAADLIFLARATRTVNKGRVRLDNEEYEADALLERHEERVDLRYNPMTMECVHVFAGGAYLCTAHPVEESSMKDMSLARRKIREKRERRLRFAEEFRRLTALAPDLRHYSAVPAAEKAAALIGKEKRKRAEDRKALAYTPTQEEIDAHIARMEEGTPLPARSPRPLPERPGHFRSDEVRFDWIVAYLRAGGELSAEDAAFKERHMAAMTEGQRDYYEFYLNDYAEAGG